MLLKILAAEKSFTRAAVPEPRGIGADVLASPRARLLMLCWAAAGLGLSRAPAQMDLPLEGAGHGDKR